MKKKWWQKSFGVIGGVGMVAVGVAKGVQCVTTGAYDGALEAVGIISAGLAALGIRKKQEKNGEVQKAILAQTVTEPATGGGGTN